jgi:DNA end-binding protein Ku
MAGTQAKALGSFTIGFGLVAIPVQIFNVASETKSKITRNQLHKDCGSRLNLGPMTCPIHGAVAKEDIVKGYEYAKGQYCLITDEDLETLPVASRQQVKIESFCPASELDPCMFDKSYYLLPGKGGQAAFALLLHGLAAEQVVGLGKFSLRSQREVLAAIRVARGVCFLHTCFYQNEMRVTLDQPLPTVGEKELALATQLIGMIKKPFDATEHEDRYLTAFEELVAKKVADPAYKTAAPATEAPTETIDLAAALAASLKQAAA